MLIHQPSYCLFNRWIEDGLLDSSKSAGAGCIAFSPLAQGMLTDRYRHGLPADSRAAHSLADGWLTETNLGPGPQPERDRRAARPVAGSDGARLGVA